MTTWISAMWYLRMWQVNPTRDLHKISNWSVKLEIPFNINKCQTLQDGSRNIMWDYKCGPLKLKVITWSKILALQSYITWSFPSSAASPLKKETGIWFWLKEIFHSRIKIYYFCMIVSSDLIWSVLCSFGLPTMWNTLLK